jgi:hypothetical protein
MVKKTRIRKQRGGGNGLILVFDLDETIVNTGKKLEFNPSILQLLQIITPLRGSKVDAVFLLTNNSGEIYINQINEELARNTDYNADTYFDYVMSYNHSMRDEDRTKSLEDIKFMMSTTRKNDENLLERTFFFDDQDHVIQEEMMESGIADHYIKITPPFKRTGEDKTNFEPVLSALDMFTGGKRKNRKTRKLRRSN